MLSPLSHRSQTPSWQWYYPYHYAPFAADFEEVGKMDIQFTLGAPFKPFEQLMGVFPAASYVPLFFSLSSSLLTLTLLTFTPTDPSLFETPSSLSLFLLAVLLQNSKVHIPEIFHDLMTDEFSPIIEFYPSDFDIDMNGKKMAWQGVALLPFIDPVRLLEHMTPRYGQLSEDDTRRNSWGTDVLFVADDHRLYDAFCKLYAKKKVKEVSFFFLDVLSSQLTCTEPSTGPFIVLLCSARPNGSFSLGRHHRLRPP
jgi:5'-3' exoribonuclease 2